MVINFEATIALVVSEILKQECPPIGRAVRNVTTLIRERPLYTMHALTCSEHVYARPCAYGRTRMCDLNATITQK